MIPERDQTFKRAELEAVDKVFLDLIIDEVDTSNVVPQVWEPVKHKSPTQWDEKHNLFIAFERNNMRRLLQKMENAKLASR